MIALVKGRSVAGLMIKRTSNVTKQEHEDENIKNRTAFVCFRMWLRRTKDQGSIVGKQVWNVKVILGLLRHYRYGTWCESVSVCFMLAVYCMKRSLAETGEMSVEDQKSGPFIDPPKEV